jgi:hypothetical protein
MLLDFNNDNDMKKIFIILVSLVAIIGCNDVDHLHKKYLDEGEITYIGKSSEIQLSSGYKRLQVLYAKSEDPKALFAEFEINGELIKLTNSEYSDSIQVIENEETDFPDTIMLPAVKYIVENLEEKDYTIKLRQTDGEGNYSIVKSAYGKVYGDKYKTSLVAQSVADYDFVDQDENDGVDSLRVRFNPSDVSVGIVVEYTDKTSNEKQTIKLTNGNLEVILPNIALGAEWNFASSFLPEGGLDTVASNFSTMNAPYRMVPRNSWTELVLADNTPDDYGWVFPRVWDNNGGSGYHSPANVQYPAVLSIDLGVQTLVKSLIMIERGGFNSRLPNNVEIWMSNTANEVGVESTDPTWESKAVEAGWTKIDKVRAKHNIYVPVDGNEYYRYVRFRILDVVSGTSAPINVMEIAFQGLTK